LIVQHMSHALAMIGRLFYRIFIACLLIILASWSVDVIWLLIGVIAYGDFARACREFPKWSSGEHSESGFVGSLVAANVATLLAALLNTVRPPIGYPRRRAKQVVASGVCGAILGAMPGFLVAMCFDESVPLIAIPSFAGVAIGVFSAAGVRLWAALPPLRPLLRRRRVWGTALCIILVLFSLLIWAAWPGSSTFTISPETTYITEPLDKDGYVDYVTALNERLRKGVTPDNNANVLICQALGPHPEGGTMPSEYFQWLGIESPPEDGAYYLGWKDYQRAHLNDGGRQFWDGNGDVLTLAGKLPWTAEDEPQILDWLNQNEKPLALIVHASRRSEYFNPLVPNRTEDWSPGLYAALLPCVQYCRECVSALRARAMFRIHEGRTDEAWQDLLACHRLGRLIARGGTLIEMLVGIAIEMSACHGDIAFLEYAKPTSKQALACCDELRKLPPMPEVSDKLDHCERLFLLDAMLLTARHGRAFLESFSNDNKPPEIGTFRNKLFTLSVDWDPALTNANRWFDRDVAALRIKERDARMKELAAITQVLKKLKPSSGNISALPTPLIGPKGRGEQIGNIMIALMTPAFDKLVNASDRCEQTHRNLHIAFALAAYLRDHGRYPANLDELAPKYLDKIPDDLFSGKPLIYRLENDGYLLYSVGVNGVDEDGQSYGDDPPGDDIVVRVPVPDPQKKN
jgi:hypothetical protein